MPVDVFSIYVPYNTEERRVSLDDKGAVVVQIAHCQGVEMTRNHAWKLVLAILRVLVMKRTSSAW